MYKVVYLDLNNKEVEKEFYSQCEIIELIQWCIDNETAIVSVRWEA